MEQLLNQAVNIFTSYFSFMLFFAILVTSEIVKMAFVLEKNPSDPKNPKHYLMFDKKQKFGMHMRWVVCILSFILAIFVYNYEYETEFEKLNKITTAEATINIVEAKEKLKIQSTIQTTEETKQIKSNGKNTDITTQRNETITVPVYKQPDKIMIWWKLFLTYAITTSLYELIISFLLLKTKNWLRAQNQSAMLISQQLDENDVKITYRSQNKKSIDEIEKEDIQLVDPKSIK